MYTVDASVWVNSFDQREFGHDTSRRVLELLRDQAVPIFLPHLVLAEVAGAVSRTRNDVAQARCVLITLDNEHLTRLTAIAQALTPTDALVRLMPPGQEEI